MLRILNSSLEYENAAFTVKVDIKYNRSSGDEFWWNDGTITLESKGGEKAIKNFVEGCG